MEDKAEKKFDEIRKIIDEHLDKYIEVIYPESIYKSMRYSLLAGGKRLRPVIAVETALMLGASYEKIIPSACAIEMLHCQSLIHDDLPCMDNDDFRRGQPSNHKVFGEAAAILAGDAFLSFAPKLIIEKSKGLIGSETLLKILSEFFAAAGTDGIISGQIVDLDSEKKKISKETLNFIYEYKTARLFKLAARAGALAGGADDKLLDDLTSFAHFYGHAFQIYDDILDCTAVFEKIGKTPKKDAQSGKSTYVSMYGIEEAKKQVLFLCENAYDILEKSRIQSDILRGIVSDISERVGKCY